MALSRCEHLALDLAHLRTEALGQAALAIRLDQDFRHRAGAETALVVAEEPEGDKVTTADGQARRPALLTARLCKREGEARLPAFDPWRGQRPWVFSDWTIQSVALYREGGTRDARRPDAAEDVAVPQRR